MYYLHLKTIFKLYKSLKKNIKIIINLIIYLVLKFNTINFYIKKISV